MYEYNAKVARIIDGDTVDLDIDLGIEITRRIRVRIAGINAPEVSTFRGRQAKYMAEQKLPTGQTFTIRTVKDRKEKYGRYLAQITMADGNDFASWMITNKLAAPWDGRGKRPAA